MQEATVLILGSALVSVCWWSCYHSSQLIVSIKSALTNWTIGSISHCCITIHSFTIQNAKNLLSTPVPSHICFPSPTAIVRFPQTIIMIVRAPLGARAYPLILSKYFLFICLSVRPSMRPSMRGCVRASVPLQISVGCVYFV